MAYCGVEIISIADTCVTAMAVVIKTSCHMCCIIQKSATTRWRASRPSESALHHQDLQGRGASQDEHRPHGQREEGLHRRGQGPRRPLRARLLRRPQGTYNTVRGQAGLFGTVCCQRCLLVNSKLSRTKKYILTLFGRTSFRVIPAK